MLRLINANSIRNVFANGQDEIAMLADKCLALCSSYLKRAASPGHAHLAHRGAFALACAPASAAAAASWLCAESTETSTGLGAITMRQGRRGVSVRPSVVRRVTVR